VKKGKSRSNGEELFAFQMKALGLEPVREYRFHPVRKFRFDFAFPAQGMGDFSFGGIAVEIEGGIWKQGTRHTSPRGYLSDMENYNLANSMGWMVLRFSTADVKSGRAANEVERLLTKNEMMRSVVQSIRDQAFKAITRGQDE
jgi:very-short-patch-repair endonuclease